MRRQIISGLFACAFLLASAAAAAAQDASEGPNFLAAGETAPDIELVGATRWGEVEGPVRLSDFQGETVVLAFFPAARTRGCTIQMKAYRDEYARVFNSGRNVVLIAISADSGEELSSWAKDEDFPFLFGSDPSGDAYRAFGGEPRANGRTGRTVVVIGPDGKIAEMIPRFREIDPTSYDELEAIVDRVTPPVEESGQGSG